LIKKLGKKHKKKFKKASGANTANSNFDKSKA